MAGHPNKTSWILLKTNAPVSICRLYLTLWEAVLLNFVKHENILKHGYDRLLTTLLQFTHVYK